ncbi:MAG: hypothetical protein ACJ754_00400 [Pyrinomonadaceae bacterium]
MTEALRQSETLPIVRSRVKDLLTRSQAFRELPKHRRDELARDMVNVAHYIVGGPDGSNTPSEATLAQQQAGASQDFAKLPQNQFIKEKVAGEDFKAAAAQQGGKALTDTIKEVDFPKFVAGLIDGVFNAIVDASIKQMNAYAELLKNVAKSVDQYMKDNVTENQSRDYLADRYPDHLELDLAGEQPKLKPKEGHDEDNMPDFFSDLGMKVPMDSFDEESVEATLVPAARQRIAMDRQQLLATMVLMGINRLVVTNGSINASVLFRLDTTDRVKRGVHQTAEQSGGGSKSSRPGFWGWFSSSVERESQWGNFKVSTAQDEDSEATSKMHVDLAGKVNINFKSETFPLEKMGDLIGGGNIQEKVAAKAPSAAGSGQPAPK